MRYKGQPWVQISTPLFEFDSLDWDLTWAFHLSTKVKRDEWPLVSDVCISRRYQAGFREFVSRNMAAVLHLNLVENFLKIIYGLSPSECSFRRSLGLEPRGLGPGTAAALGCFSGLGRLRASPRDRQEQAASPGQQGRAAHLRRWNWVNPPGAGIIVS